MILTEDILRENPDARVVSFHNYEHKGTSKYLSFSVTPNQWFGVDQKY